MNLFKICAVIAFCAALSLSFTVEFDKISAIDFSSRCLYKGFDPTDEGKITGWQFYVTPDNFMRFKKIYFKGRQAYFSFNIHRFQDLSYIGDHNRGIVQIKTQADDIIVQTYNDPKGNVDSMSTILKIPVRNVSAEQIDSLKKALTFLKAH
ncbi:hypothetical protein [Mucilaginibacter sp. CSA2-8R]|uniref:hypothetical protein n=1 Tax=Mucilaginibacter sp. CSA2-8R TaxID=3141542 RepID=UPI00315D049D